MKFWHAGRYPAANIFGFQRGADSIRYRLIVVGVGDKNRVRQFRRLRLSYAWTVSQIHVFAGSNWFGL
jgi:hypothetical protein